MRKVVCNALVEISVPDELDVVEYCMDAFGISKRSVKIGINLKLQDFKLRIPPVTPVGQIGNSRLSSNDSGQVVTIKNLLLRRLIGDMLPVYDGDGNMVFFTLEKEPEPVVVE